jgi:chromosome segregation ATPase
MANENKNINELVSGDSIADDDDPTAELEILTFRQFESDDVELELTEVERESDSDTYGFRKKTDGDSSDGQSIPELRSDLERRTQTIGRLQFDIEQLRAKWLGLETEITAREEIVNNLLGEVDRLKGQVSRKDKLLKKRARTIKSLKSDVSERDDVHAALEQQLTELNQQLTAQQLTDEGNVSALEETRRELGAMHSELESAQNEIASLRSEVSERDETHTSLERQQAELEQRLDRYAGALEENELELEKTRSTLEAAEQRIAALRSENGQQDEAHELLEKRHAELQQQLTDTAAALEKKEYELEKLHSRLISVRDQSAAELDLTKQTSTSAVKEAKAQLARAEKYADTLRFKFQDFTESESRWLKERDRLNETVDQISESNWLLSEKLEAAGASIIELQAAIRQQHDDDQQEISALRVELGKAQDAVTTAEELNTQLASDLAESHGSKAELERMLRQNDGAAQDRIAELEGQIGELTQTIEDLERKLGTRGNTISVLLGELAKKSEQIESIGKIENVIHEIDNRMSERFDDQDQSKSINRDAAQDASDRDRITRVLIGKIGDQELRFPLFKNRLTIGRSDSNDIQLKTTYVSRSHAVILTEGDTTRVIDSGSKNGVFVNSEKVKERLLSNGDVVAIGDVKFLYEERPKRDA